MTKLPLCPAEIFEDLRWRCPFTGNPGKANLVVHQYQVAADSLNRAVPEDEESIQVGAEACFFWKWSKPASSDLEVFARTVYDWGVETKQNHALVHVAIAGLAQLGHYWGEVWDIADTGPYVLVL